MIAKVATVLLAAFTSVSYAQDVTNPSTPQNAMDNKAKVVALLKSIETGDAAPVSFINPNQYKQHNLGIKDGLAGFGEALAALPKGSARSCAARAGSTPSTSTSAPAAPARRCPSTSTPTAPTRRSRTSGPSAATPGSRSGSPGPTPAPWTSSWCGCGPPRRCPGSCRS